MAGGPGRMSVLYHKDVSREAVKRNDDQTKNQNVNNFMDRRTLKKSTDE